jgi:predicted ATP-grasp superfamily ATP-dependent carboligase
MTRIIRLFIFEYISSGGFNRSLLPEALAKEGQLMLQAMLDNVAALPQITRTVLLDYRVLPQFALNTALFQVVQVMPDDDLLTLFTQQLDNADAVWLVAPETDGVLAQLCHLVVQRGKQLLTSPADAVTVAGDKWASYQLLQQHGIATVPTELAQQATPRAGHWLLKARDGVAGQDSYILHHPSEWAAYVARYPNALIQPQIQAETYSLSCLCRNGTSVLLSVNQQYFRIEQRQYHLSALTVNALPISIAYQTIVNQVARALPRLWGYVGIDVLVTPTAILVLDINPRLTSSFVGLQAALGINLAELLLKLATQMPTIEPHYSRAITLSVK